MKRQKQQLHIAMDESDAPYKDNEYTRTLEDDLIGIRIAKQYGITFIPGSRLDKLSRTLDADTSRLSHPLP